MKNKILFIASIILFFFISIYTFNIKANSYNVSDCLKVIGAQIRTSGNVGIRFVCKTDEIKEAKKYGIILAYGEIDNIDDFVINSMINSKSVINADVSSLSNNQYFVTLYDIPESMYNKKVSARAYYVDMNDEIIYSETYISRSLKDVCFYAYNNEDDRSEIVTKVYEYFVISSIDLYIDFTIFNAEYDLVKYAYTYSNPNFYKVTIKLYLKEGFEFSNDFVLYANSKLADKSKYTIEDNSLTYIFLDPHWTDIY